ncbi:OLC1v1030053C1 [Oldenlandia corymbosa var. corymbosa]|uniref:OLC1v1030053C1 n=1 Tax=Oldenlandia corymbosa var. corymbosa TaxID=529605 RepID=A0AAV1CFY5_OLDCO|nr:OLC1v1030053C1 [Oldenlandia corymbosa var. corymbosa]
MLNLDKPEKAAVEDMIVFGDNVAPLVLKTLAVEDDLFQGKDRQNNTQPDRCDIGEDAASPTAATADSDQRNNGEVALVLRTLAVDDDPSQERDRQLSTQLDQCKSGEDCFSNGSHR